LKDKYQQEILGDNSWEEEGAMVVYSLVFYDSWSGLCETNPTTANSSLEYFSS